MHVELQSQHLPLHPIILYRWVMSERVPAMTRCHIYIGNCTVSTFYNNASIRSTPSMGLRFHAMNKGASRSFWSIPESVVSTMMHMHGVRKYGHHKTCCWYQQATSWADITVSFKFSTWSGYEQTRKHILCLIESNKLQRSHDWGLSSFDLSGAEMAGGELTIVFVRYIHFHHGLCPSIIYY
jgi:hypothetical protein